MVYNVNPRFNGRVEWEMENFYISSIRRYGKRRFSDILNDIEGISNRMLSNELKY